MYAYSGQYVKHWRWVRLGVLGFSMAENFKG